MYAYVDAEKLVDKLKNVKKQYGRLTKVNAHNMLNVVIAMIREEQSESGSKKADAEMDKVALHLNTFRGYYEIEYTDGTIKRVYDDGRVEWLDTKNNN